MRRGGGDIHDEETAEASLQETDQLRETGLDRRQVRPRYCYYQIYRCKDRCCTPADPSRDTNGVSLGILVATVARKARGVYPGRGTCASDDCVFSFFFFFYLGSIGIERPFEDTVEKWNTKTGIGSFALAHIRIVESVCLKRHKSKKRNRMSLSEVLTLDAQYTLP